MAEVKWIKITVDMFCNRKIRHLRRLPEGDSIVLIWVMLLTMAGRCNSGGLIFLTENIPYTPKMLADELDFEESTVQLALSALSTLGMVCIDENRLCIPGWEEYQNIDGLEKIRNQTRERTIRYRERLALEKECVTCDASVTSHVTSRDATDKEREKEGDLRDTILSGKPDDLPQKCALIIARLNEKTGANFRSTTESTRRHIHARLEEGFTVDDFYAVIDSKAAEWGNDPKMAPYLRPDTLFCTKFEGYLQAAKRNATGGGVWAREEQDDLDFVK